MIPSVSPDQAAACPPKHPQDAVLTLASGSAARLRLLRDAGLRVQARAPGINETPLPGELPGALALRLACAKAAAVPGHLVLGSDQVLAMGDRVFAKPASPKDAAAQLSALAGRTHRLLSAAALARGGTVFWHTVVQARLTMHPLDPDQIDAYVGRYWDVMKGCVGCYRIEAEGASLMAEVHGDPFTIQGLPLIQVLGALRRNGLLNMLTAP